MMFPALLLFIGFLTIAFLMWPSFGRKTNYGGQHVLISGGSRGIGLALAKEFVKRDANITLVGRTLAGLEEAVTSLIALAEEVGVDPEIHICQMDVRDFDKVQSNFKSIEERLGPVTVVVCAAGVAEPGRFLEQNITVYEKTMAINYFGTLNVLKAAVPGMVERKAGQIVMVASAMAVCGFTGYTSYAPTKWAVRGLADCLRNELLASGVKVSIAYPPDTDTPGYAVENRTKPDETHRISRLLGDKLHKPEDVARCMLRGLERGKYHLPTPDFGLDLMVTTSAALSPRSFPMIVEAILAPFVALTLRGFGVLADRIVRKAESKQ